MKKGIIWIAVLVVFLPVLYLIYAGLNDSEFMSADFRGLTFKWLMNTLSNGQFLNALGYTIFKGVIVGVLSSFLGLALAISYLTSGRLFKVIIVSSLVILFIMPPTSYCLNLLSLARFTGLDRGLFLTIVGQTAQALPTIAFLLVPTLKNISLSEFEAAMLLGVPKLRASWQFIGKRIINHLLLAFSIGGYISMDDLVANVYLGGTSGGTSITKLIWESMRSDINPVVAWYSLTLTIIGAIVIIQFARTGNKKQLAKAHS